MSMKLAVNSNVDRSFVGRIVMKAAVITCKRTSSPEFSTELEAKEGTSKEQGPEPIISPTGVEVDPFAPASSSC